MNVPRTGLIFLAFYFFFVFQKSVSTKTIYATKRTVNGHPVLVMTKYAGVVFSEPQRHVPHIRKPCGVHTPTVRRAHKTAFDRRNQTVYYVKPGGGGGGGGVYVFQDGGDDKPKSEAANRKGRPRGSKNKASLNSFNYQCEKRSFTYTYTSPAVCKSCGRTFDGDPLAHCLEYHKTVCPVCGRACAPPLAAHIKSHGARQVSLSVTCYECYDCKEKFGNGTTMAEHVLDEHVNRSGAKDVACCVCNWSRYPGTVDDLREHVTAAHAGAADTAAFPDRCGYCGQQTDRRRLVEHLLDKHLHKTVDDLMCMLCGVQFDDRAATVGHMVAAHCPQKTFSHPAVYRCRVCQAGFKSQINVLRHACNKIKTPHCEQCGKTFPSKMRYAFHLQFHAHPKGAVPMHLHCDLCLAEFDDEYHLYDHIRFRHELHDKAVCEVCGRTFKSSMGLNIHRRYHNGSRNFTCKSCDKSFLNKSTLKEHEISHMDVKPFQCHICGQYLSRASRLRSHVKTHRAAESTEQKCYRCGACGFVAPSPALLAEHVAKEQHGVDGDRAAAALVVELSSVVKCEFCDSTYMNAVYLNEHRDAAHAASENTEAFICVVCSSTFSTYSRLTTHKLTHGINMESTLAGDDPATDRDRFHIPQFFSCQYCAKMCLHYTYFCLHRRLKHPLGVQTYTCDRCFLDFKTSWRLSYHRKTVHGQPPSADKSSEKFKCTVCARKFVKIGALNLHKTRTHIDIVGDICKYLCHQCGKFFSSEGSLRNHVKVHENSAGKFWNPVVSQRNRHRTYRKPAAAEDGPAITGSGRPAITDGGRPAITGGGRPAASGDAPAARGDRPVARGDRSAAGDKPSAMNSCPYCTQTIADKTEFIEHVNRHLQHKSVLPAGTVCELCDDRFENSVQLKFHLQNHANTNEAFLCRACYAPFLSSAAFDQHMAKLCPTTTLPPTVPPVGQQPVVRFIGASGNESSDAATDDPAPPPPPLVVDCSQIFKLSSRQTASPRGWPAGSVSPVGAAAADSAPNDMPNDITDDILDDMLNGMPDSMPNDRSDVLDELLAIISTPRTMAAFESVDLPPSDDINDIFNSIVF